MAVAVLSILLFVALAFAVGLLYALWTLLKKQKSRETPRHQAGIADDMTFLAFDKILDSARDYDLFFRAVMNNVPFPVYCKDADDDFRYLFYNKTEVAAESGSFLGKTDFDVFPPDIAEQTRRNDVETSRLSIGAVNEYSEHFLAADNTVHPCKSFKQIIRTQAGRRFLLGLSIDMSEEYALRQSVEETSEILQTILDNIPACILAKDVRNNLRHIIWNKELERHTGITAEQIIGKTDLEIEPWPGLGQFIRELDMQTIRDGQVYQEQLCLTASGRQILYRTNKRSCRLPSGRHLLIDMCLDMTRQHELETLNRDMIEYQRDVIAKDQLLNECMRFAGRETDRDAVVNYLLQRVGIEFNADRCFTYQYRDSDCRFADCRCEWTARDAASLLFQQNLDMDSYEYLQSHLKSFQTLVVDDIDDMPQGDCREYMRRRNIRSTIIAPVQIGDRLCGFIGLDFVRSARIFSENDMRLLNNTASLLGLIGARDYYRILLRNVKNDNR